MPDSAPPLVTLTTDFGQADFYVAAMKGSLLRYCPRAVLVDVTHAVPRHDILFGSFMLERAISAFPDGTIHIAVVDPGVGTHRRILVARWTWQTVFCPDNGLITWASRRHGQPDLYELTWRPPATSAVFHGRDIMAPAAGMLAAGSAIDAIARPAADQVLLDIAPATNVQHGGVILHIDAFGNATTNVPAELLIGTTTIDVQAAARSLGSLRRTYHDVPPGTPLALIGSSGLLEIAVCEGSAADVLGLCVGDRMEVTVGV